MKIKLATALTGVLVTGLLLAPNSGTHGASLRLDEFKFQLAGAQNYHEWVLIREDIQEWAEAVQDTATQEELVDICGELKKLVFSELVDFENFLNQVRRLPCANNLHAELNLHWSEREESLLQVFTERKGREAMEVTPKLRVVEKVVPVEDGPFYAHADLPRGYIALTFDDGPHSERTLDILQTLREFGAKATYFMVGERADANPGVAAAVKDQKHSVGSHSWDHSLLTKLPFEEALENIYRGHETVDEVVDGAVPFFRFPYGAMSTELKTSVKETPMANFFWNMDSLDWKIKDPEELLNYALDQVELADERGILLFHDVHEQTALIMPYLLREFADRGYSLVLFVTKDTASRRRRKL